MKKKVRSKPGIEVLKRLLEVQKQFDNHVKDAGDGRAVSSCGECCNYQGRISELRFVIGYEY